MSYDEEREVLRTSEDGRYRAVRIRDQYPHKPENYGETPILRIETGWSLDVEAHNEHAEPFVEAYRRLHELRQGSDAEVFERYLRIFHGTQGVAAYGPNPYTDAMYYAFDTDAWTELMGITNEEHRITAAKDSLEETVNWLEGDVYFLTVEELTTGACGHDGCEEHTSWEEVEAEYTTGSPSTGWKKVTMPVAIHGFYGDNQYTRVDAVDEHFGHYFETTKAA